MNSSASHPLAMPPTPTMGSAQAARQVCTAASATGLSAGPESPPVTPPSSGFSVQWSIASPRSVFVSTSASAPPRSAARAIAARSATLGESLTHSGSRVAARQRRTTASVSAGSLPIEMQPLLTFGQETLSSSAAMPGSPSSRRQASS